MKFIPINEIQQGMILASSIYDERSVVLLSANRKITKRNISQIEKMGYRGIYIFEDSNDIKDFDEIISEELRIDAVKNLKNLNIDAVVYLTNKIVNEILCLNDFLINLTDLKNYHNYTYNHCVDVAILSVKIGIGLGLNDKQLRDLAVSAMLHDIGKTGVSRDILDKPDGLDDVEYNKIKEHPVIGYNLLLDNTNIASTSKVGILFHHENEDGSGYPKGLKGDEIPLYSKIIHVADVYDALISDRSYKPAYTPSEAIEYLMGNCGRMFDIRVVEAFIKYIAIYPTGSQVSLSDGRKATVLRNSTSAVMRPLIKTDDDEIIDLLTNKNHYNLVII